MTRWIYPLILLITFSCLSYAQTTKSTKAKAQKETVAKLVCPVTGEDADEEVTYAYKGKTYYFCCKNCVTKFKKEPEKFIKASAKGQYDPCDHGGEADDHEGHGHEGHGHEGHGHEGHHHDSMPSEVSAASVETAGDVTVINVDKDLSADIVNSKCPVMGSKVDPKTTTVTYKGKVYGFCCKGCTKKFAANPEKYLSE